MASRHGLFACLIAGAFAVRLLAYAQVDAPPPLFADALYRAALEEHLAEYLWTNTLKPPLTYLVHAALLGAFGGAAVAEWNLALLLAYAMDIVAAVLLYASATMLGVERRLAAVSIALCSLAQLPFEQWWHGAHYDHHTLLFTALFLWSMCRVMVAPGGRALAALSCAACLLILQSTVNAMVVPLTLAALFAHLARDRGWTWGRAMRRMVLVGLLPGLVVAGLVAKNFAVAGVAATSNLGGMAAIMVVSRAVEGRIDKLREAAARAGAPPWYLWCFDHAVPFAAADGRPSPGWELHAQESGICYPWTRRGEAFWPHDFRPLRAKLEELGEGGLAGLVDRDIEDAARRQYLFAGFSANASARWIGAYGSVSAAVYRRYIAEHPLAFLGTAGALFVHFAGGAIVPAMMRGPDLQPAPGLARLGALVIPAGVAFAAVTLCGLLLSFCGWLYLLRLHARSGGAGSGPRLAPAGSALRAHVPFAVPAVLLALVFSVLVGGENHRYFQQAAPYLTVVALLFFEHALRRRRRSPG